MLILQEVLDVAQFMMDCKELALSNLSALLNAHIILKVKVPGAGMTDQIATISGFLNDRLIPEDSGIKK